MFAEIGEVINGTAAAFCERTTVFKSLGKFLLFLQDEDHIELIKFKEKFP